MKRLVLNQHDKKIAGLCAGLADYFEVDVTIIRLIVLVMIIMTYVVPGVLIYFIAAAITPKGENPQAPDTKPDKAPAPTQEKEGDNNNA